jgi:hypothetical protein
MLDFKKSENDVFASPESNKVHARARDMVFNNADKVKLGCLGGQLCTQLREASKVETCVTPFRRQ